MLWCIIFILAALVLVEGFVIIKFKSDINDLNSDINDLNDEIEYLTLGISGYSNHYRSNISYGD